MAYVIKIKAKYRNDQTGRELLLPAVFTESGLLLSHIRYLATRPRMSASWYERSAFSIMLLIKFINANELQFTKTTDLLRAFSLAIVEGTINPSTLVDISGLYWSPRRIGDARVLLSLITKYTDWLHENNKASEKQANPFRKATSTEQRLNWCAYYHRKNNVFLNHLSVSALDKDAMALVRSVIVPREPLVKFFSVKRFPESEIRNLLDNGFIRAHSKFDTHEHERVDYKNQAIAILLHYGGVRKSEALHLYLGDISIDRKRTEAIVKVYHPSNGSSPNPSYKTRKDFLAKCFRLKPRNEYYKSERLHLGWKSPLLTDRRGFFQVNFFPPDKAVEFLFVWANYLKYQRINPADGKDHPYAFTNSKGDPETLKNFQRLHKAAVQRIGLRHDKYLGTTEHGHRHSYGYRLAEHGLRQVEIQKAMHHKSPGSCLTYIQPSDDELRQKMLEAKLND
ncbi:gamma-mobile-trio recombinase GmtY [Pseudomonas sp. TMP25]|uniref:gamma-mobile-trio recombinase GmtY n=1 Tax=Pseudomonas sp. TMP25 TaxID=3136561 RepID=UPI003101987D